METDDFKKAQRREAPPPRFRERESRMYDGDDLSGNGYDDDLYDEDAWHPHQMHGLPAAVRAHRARQRLERHMERRRLMADLADGFDDETEGRRSGRRQDHRNARRRRKSEPET